MGQEWQGLLERGTHYRCLYASARSLQAKKEELKCLVFSDNVNIEYITNIVKWEKSKRYSHS